MNKRRFNANGVRIPLEILPSSAQSLPIATVPPNPTEPN